MGRWPWSSTTRSAPRGPEDEKIAEQATEYVNYVFNCDNPGFLILHNWFKDAFLAKVGIVKVWWEDTSRTDTEEMPLQDDMHAQFVRAHPDYQGEQDGVAYMGSEVKDGRVRIENIPPEEFRISPASRSDQSSMRTSVVDSIASARPKPARAARSS